MVSLFGTLVLAIALVGCPPAVDGRQEARCFAACTTKANARCNEQECARGCRFILDRLVEREDGHVLACVAQGTGPCKDDTWAQCAAKVGIHADGGPPVPAALGAEPEDEGGGDDLDKDDEEEKPEVKPDAGKAKPPAKPAAKPPAKAAPATKPAPAAKPTSKP
jgi:hypothetical protein